MTTAPAALLAAAPPTYRDALAVRPFRLLLGCHSLATAAQLLITLAVGLEVLARTGSALGASASIAVGFAPYAVCSGAAGVLADRWSRSRVLAASAAVRAVLAAGTLVAMVAALPVPVLVAAAAATAVAATPAYPSLAAATAQRVPDHELPAANALVTGAENALWIAGPGLLGVLSLAGLGPAAVTGVAATMLLGATACALAAPLPRPPVVATPPGDVLAGARLVLRLPHVRRPFAAAVLVNLLGGYLVVHVVLVDPGALNTALAAGAGLGLVAVNRLTRGPRQDRVLAAGVTVFALSCVALGVAGGTSAGVLAAALAGGASLAAEVVAVTLLQRAAPADAVARLFGVYDQVNVGAIAVGSLVAGPLAAGLGAGAALVVTAGAVLLGTAALLGRRRPIASAT